MKTGVEKFPASGLDEEGSFVRGGHEKTDYWNKAVGPRNASRYCGSLGMDCASQYQTKLT